MCTFFFSASSRLLFISLSSAQHSSSSYPLVKLKRHLCCERGERDWGKWNTSKVNWMFSLLFCVSVWAGSCLPLVPSFVCPAVFHSLTLFHWLYWWLKELFVTSASSLSPLSPFQFLSKARGYISIAPCLTLVKFDSWLTEYFECERYSLKHHRTVQLFSLLFMLPLSLPCSLSETQNVQSTSDWVSDFLSLSLSYFFFLSPFVSLCLPLVTWIETRQVYNGTSKIVGGDVFYQKVFATLSFLCGFTSRPFYTKWLSGRCFL